MLYGADIIYGDSSLVIYFEVQGFVMQFAQNARVLPHFSRRLISKLLAGIALPQPLFITLYHLVTEQIMEVT